MESQSPENKRIRVIGPRAMRITNIGPTLPRVDHKEVAEALGAELVTDPIQRPARPVIALTAEDKQEAVVLADNISSIELAERVVLLQKMLEDCNARMRAFFHDVGAYNG